MKTNHPITFRHHYYKLDHPEFTTIRGKAQFKRLQVGQTVTCQCPHATFDAIITKLEAKCVCQMTIAFLKADAEYPGCTLSTHQQFVNLLNSFRAPYWAQVSLESELTIITLTKTTACNKPASTP